jgi:hypothetical protein
VTDDQCNINLSLLDRIAENGVSFHAQLHSHARIDSRELRQHSRKNCSEILRAAQTYYTFERSALKFLKQFIVQSENASRIAQCGLASFCQRQTAATLLKKRHAELVLQPLHLKADRGRGTTETVGSLSESTQIVSCGERPQCVQIKVGGAHGIPSNEGYHKSRLQSFPQKEIDAGGHTLVDRVQIYCCPKASPMDVLSVPTILHNAAVLTIVIAFAGYLITIIGARMLNQHRDKLELVNKRLNEFYGPLYVASEAGNIAYRSLLKRQGKSVSEPIRDAELKEWILWMNTIFMPLNDIREKIIIEKAYLVVEEQMPQCLLDFVTHVVGYKAVMAKWAEGDFTERRSTIGWPPEFDVYVKKSFAALKAQQTDLLHSSAWRLWNRFFGK